MVLHILGLPEGAGVSDARRALLGGPSAAQMAVQRPRLDALLLLQALFCCIFNCAEVISTPFDAGHPGAG